MITKSPSGRNRNPQYRARISVSNTHRGILEGIQTFYGGFLVDEGCRVTNWNPAFRLIWTDRKVARILSQIAPHLRIKQQQAFVLIDFLRHKNLTHQGRRGKYFAPHPDEVLAHREALYRRVRELNARGSHPKLRGGADRLQFGALTLAFA